MGDEQNSKPTCDEATMGSRAKRGEKGKSLFVLLEGVADITFATNDLVHTIWSHW